MAGHVACMEENSGVRIFSRKHEGQRRDGIQRRSWEDNIKMNFT